MSQKQLFNAELFKTNNLMNLKIRYVNSKNSPISKNIPIYSDDSCKDVILKLSSFHSNCVSEHIFAWYKVGTQVIPLTFIYPSVELDYPFKGNKQPDSRFSNDGNRILVLADKTPMYNLIQNYPIKTLFYTTIHEYLSYLNLPKNRLITDELCEEKTGYSTNDIYNGIIVKYWPNVTQQQAMNLPGTTNPSKLKIESSIVKQLLDQSGAVYSSQKVIEPEEINLQIFSISTDVDDNIVQLARLFSDIKLGETILEDTSLSFSKITLEDHTSRYCKLLKDTIVVSSVDNQRYVTKELFSTWFKNQVTSLPSSTLKFMDESNSVMFKFYKGSKVITLVLYSNGRIQLLFSGNSLTINDDYIKDIIPLMNNFIDHLNRKRVYSDKPLQRFELDYKNSLDCVTSQFIYPIKNYKRDLFIQMLKNMSSFVRYNKSQDSKIIAVFKRVDQYGQSIASVISSLHRSRRNLTREEILSELEILFNISNDEAIDEYENWETDPSSKFFKGGEEGVEIILDLLGTNVKVDIIGSKSYEMTARIYQFLNFMMTYYDSFLKSKKDPLQLMKKSAEVSLTEQVAIDDIEQELRMNEQIEAVIETDTSAQVVSQESEDSVARQQQSRESQLQEVVDGASDSPRSVQLSASNSVPLEIESEPNEESEELIDSESGSDLSIGPLDELDSEGGGPTKKQTGGYNVNRYYLNRLKKYDNDMFKNYKNIPRKNQFAVKCQSVADRQPVPVTKRDLERYEQSGEGEGVAYSEAINIPGRDPNIYYICPKYWDIKDERPRDPLKIDEFRDAVVDNTMTTSQKKNTDNYILVRNENGYWREAGDNIDRYTIRMLKGSHPDGYELPCCHAPRKGALLFPNGWEVEVLKLNRGKYQWKLGTVVSSTKQAVTVRIGGTIETVPIGQVRRRKGKNTLNYNFPLDIDAYGHIDTKIKQFVQQPVDNPEVPDHNYGLLRKGVFRASGKGDQSLLESIAEILDETNKSADELRNHIIYDLLNLYKQNTQIIMSIAGGSFINKFKMDVIQFIPQKRLKFLRYMKAKYPFVNKNMKLIQKNRKKEKLPSLSADELFLKFLRGGTKKERLLINNELNIYSALVQFENYLKDPSEIITDEFLSPVLSQIAKYPSKTFNYTYSHLAIVVFEGINEDIIISPPVGGFPNKIDSLMLLYKERRNMYEPILYRKYEEHMGILRMVNEGNYMYDQNPMIKLCMDSIQQKLDDYNNELEMEPIFPSLAEVTACLDKLDMPKKSYVYDNYYKVVYIETEDNVFIPISPCGIEDYMKLTYLLALNKSEYPTYDKVVRVLEKIEPELPLQYLDAYSISVVNTSSSSVNLVVKEIILKHNVYIPIQPESYDTRKFTCDVSINESYIDIDKQLGLLESARDNRSFYLEKHQYAMSIQNLLFQKIYLEIKGKPRLLSQIHIIKYHPIKLRQHKSEEIFELIDPVIRSKLVILDESPVNEYVLQEIRNKVIIQPVDDMSAELVYYKMVKLMIEYLLNYSEQDYERFLQLDINLSKLRSVSNPNELIFSYKDIVNDYHLEYFVRHSRFIRNYILPDEPVQKSKLIQVHRLKEKTKRNIQGEFTKQYPQIVHRKFGRSVNMLNYKLDTYSMTQVIHRVFTELFENDEITEELIESLIQNEITKESLDRVTSNPMFQKIGICVIQKPVEKLTHDIIISYYRKIESNVLVVFYQTKDSLVHVKKREGEFTFKDLPKP